MFQQIKFYSYSYCFVEKNLNFFSKFSFFIHTCMAFNVIIMQFKNTQWKRQIFFPFCQAQNRYK